MEEPQVLDIQYNARAINVVEEPMLKRSCMIIDDTAKIIQIRFSRNTLPSMLGRSHETTHMRLNTMGDLKDDV